MLKSRNRAFFSAGTELSGLPQALSASSSPSNHLSADGPGSRLGGVVCMLGNGTNCLEARTVRNRNGKANEDKKKRNDRDVSMIQQRTA